MIRGQVNGLEFSECKNFLEELDNLNGIRCRVVQTDTEYLSPLTSFDIGMILNSIPSSSHIFLRFFNRNQGYFSINFGSIHINAADSITDINKKLLELVG